MAEFIERLAHLGEGPKIARLSKVPLFEHVPRRQLAVSKPLSAACASPKATPASRGTISRRRIASSCCTSASRFFPAGWLRDCQSSTAD